MLRSDKKVAKIINKAVKLIKNCPHTIKNNNKVMSYLDHASEVSELSNNNLIFSNINEILGITSKFDIKNSIDNDDYVSQDPNYNAYRSKDYPNLSTLELIDKSMTLNNKIEDKQDKQLNQNPNNYFYMPNRDKLNYKPLTNIQIIKLVKIFQLTVQNHAYGYKLIGNVKSNDTITNATNLSVAFRGLTNCAVKEHKKNIFKKYHLAQRRSIFKAIKLFNSTTQKRLHKQVSDLFAYDIVKVINPANDTISIQAPTSSDVNHIANALLD